MNVPVLDLIRQYESIREEMDAAVLEVVRSGKYVLGPYVKAFEEKAAAYCECAHAIGVASGTDALLLSLRALDIGPGDCVILPSFTFFATAGVVHNVGATPVFCDIHPKTFNADPEHVRELLGDSELAAKTRAIIPVHLYGQIADMDELHAIGEEYGVAIIEDAAQAIGSRYKGARAGTLGATGCFSFYPTKNLGAYGDGGMITTDDDELADRLRILRVHGSRPKYFHRMVGVNSRLDAIQAAILGVKLAHLDRWSAAREAVATRYDTLLADVDGIVTPARKADRTHIFHQYTVRVAGGGRDGLREHLGERGIGTMIYYPKPLHLQECFAHLGYREGSLPVTERASAEVLSLPIFPELTDAEQAVVVDEIRSHLSGGREN